MTPFSFTDLQHTPVDWIWRGRLARGMITILQADAGAGKGLVSHSLAACITTGFYMPGDQEHDPKPPLPPRQNVLFCISEDNEEALLVRAVAAGSELARLKGIHASRSQDLMGPETAMRYALENLELTLSKEQPALVVIDPLVGFFESLGAACNRDVRRALTLLTAIAERRKCAILAIHHLNKTVSRSAIHRGSGAAAIAAVARFVLTIGVDPTDPAYRILACVKNNVAAMPPSLRFTINPYKSQFQGKPIESAKIYWGSEVEMTADQILGTAAREKPLSALANAEIFLETVLRDGPIDQSKIAEQARSRGITLPALRNAKARLNVRSIKRHDPGGAYWEWAFGPLEPNSEQRDSC